MVWAVRRPCPTILFTCGYPLYCREDSSGGSEYRGLPCASYALCVHMHGTSCKRGDDGNLDCGKEQGIALMFHKIVVRAQNIPLRISAIPEVVLHHAWSLIPVLLEDDSRDIRRNLDEVRTYARVSRMTCSTQRLTQ